MARDKHKDSFWLSYSDLMTSLFFIMLVLFIVCIGKMGKALGDANATNEQLRQIIQLETQFATLSQSSTLKYIEENKTFIAKDFEGIEIFESDDNKIKPIYLGKVKQVGKDIEKLLAQLHEKNPQFSYLLVIEGMSANRVINPWNPNRPYNYCLSYARAMSLYLFWEKEGINLRKYNTEIQICGSGLNGINRDKGVEANNKRFVIQIIPKISRPKLENVMNELSWYEDVE